MTDTYIPRRYKRVAMFMGSQAPNYRHEQEALLLSEMLAEAGHDLVWGGQSSGLMKKVGDIFQCHNRDLIGITTRQIRDFCDDMHPACTITRVVTNEGERDELYREFANIFVVLPGGYGSLREAAAQIGQSYVDIHQMAGQNPGRFLPKPVIFLNPDGYWNNFLAQLNDCTAPQGMEGAPYVHPAARLLIWPHVNGFRSKAINVFDYIVNMEATLPPLWRAIRKSLRQRGA